MILKLAALAFSIQICFTSAVCNAQNKSKRLSGVKVESSMEVANWDGFVDTIPNRYSIFYADSLTFIKYLYLRDSSHDDISCITPIDAYLIFPAGSVNGYQIEASSNGWSGNQMQIEFLSQHFRNGFDLYRYMDRRPDSLHSIGDTLIETYKFQPTDTTGPVTARLYFSNRFKDYPESFDRAFDSARGRKIFRYEIINDAFFQPKINFHFPVLRSVIEMKALTNEELAEAESALQWYKHKTRSVK